MRLLGYSIVMRLATGKKTCGHVHTSIKAARGCYLKREERGWKVARVELRGDALHYERLNDVEQEAAKRIVRLERQHAAGTQPEVTIDAGEIA
jgi:hypothetical protein